MQMPTKPKNKIADWWTRHDNSAGFFSAKRYYLSTLAEKYLRAKLSIFFLCAIVLYIALLLIVDFIWPLNSFQEDLLAAILLILFFAVSITYALVFGKKHKKEMDEYIRTNFNLKYGPGEYDRIMRELKKKRHSK